MKAKTAKYLLLAVAAATVAMTFIQPTVIHQLVVWVSGMFALLLTVGLFVVGYEQQDEQGLNTDTGIIKTVKSLRALEWSDNLIASRTGIDIDVVKAIP